MVAADFVLRSNAGDIIPQVRLDKTERLALWLKDETPEAPQITATTGHDPANHFRLLFLSATPAGVWGHPRKAAHERHWSDVQCLGFTRAGIN
jgi:hypothetical protein